MSDVKSLVEKWAPVLDVEGLAPVRDKRKREVTAVLLENQEKTNRETVRRDPTLSMTYLTESPANSMGASSSTAGDGAVDIYDPVLISLVRRSMPNLIAYDVCGVQPMTMPTGLIFALRSRYDSQSGVEALFNEANTAFSGSAKGNTASVQIGQTGTDPNDTYTFERGMSTADRENLGSDRGNDINEMAISIEKVAVTAKARALKAEYSHEMSQDLKNVHGLDLESELANMLTSQILADINREVIRSIYTTATIGAQSNTATAGTFDLDVDANGRWMVEKFKGLVYQLEREANEIAKATRQGKGNFIITSADVASALNMAGLLDVTPALKGNLEVDDTGNTFAGVLYGKIKVFIDPYFSSTTGSQFATVGYKGSNPFDAGIFYAPYVPLQMYRTAGEQSFAPKIAFSTRYGMVAHPFATSAADGDIATAKKNKYYRIIKIDNLM